EIVAHTGAISGIELAIQAGRRIPYVVQETVCGFQNGRALSLVIALTEHRVEDLAGIAFHRQRLIGTSIRDVAARLAAKFHRRQWRVISETPRRDLIDRRATALGHIAGARED